MYISHLALKIVKRIICKFLSLHTTAAVHSTFVSVYNSWPRHWSTFSQNFLYVCCHSPSSSYVYGTLRSITPCYVTDRYFLYAALLWNFVKQASCCTPSISPSSLSTHVTSASCAIHYSYDTQLPRSFTSFLKDTYFTNHSHRRFSHFPIIPFHRYGLHELSGTVLSPS